MDRQTKRYTKLCDMRRQIKALCVLLPSVKYASGSSFGQSARLLRGITSLSHGPQDWVTDIQRTNQNRGRETHVYKGVPYYIPLTYTEEKWGSAWGSIHNAKRKLYMGATDAESSGFREALAYLLTKYPPDRWEIFVVPLWGD